MKARTFLVLLILFLHAPALHAHPLHLSITNIQYVDGKLEIQMKTFRDDWEIGYFHYHGRPIDFRDPEKRDLPWFGTYLRENFRISFSKRGPDLKILLDSVQLEEDAMELHMHILLPEKPKSLYIYHALLTDIYPDQTNLLIFSDGKRESGIKFDVRKRDAEVILR